jgi:hypothetical protein
MCARKVVVLARTLCINGRRRVSLPLKTSRFFSRPANTAPIASIASVISSLALVSHDHPQ